MHIFINKYMKEHGLFLFEKLASLSFKNSSELSRESVLRIYSTDVLIHYGNDVFKRQR